MNRNREPRLSATTRTIGLRTRWLAPLGAVAVIVLLVMGAGSAAACSTPPSTAPTVLATIPLLDAIAANSTTVFIQGVTNCSEIYAISESGSVSLYATLPIGPNVTCSEGALALAPSTTCSYSTSNVTVAPTSLSSSGSGEWGKKGSHGKCSPCHNNSGMVLYDVVAGVLYEITDGGSNVTIVATFSVPNASNLNMGLAYDQVGAFHHDLVVTSSSGGKVWLVNESGNVTLFTSLHTYIGGPAFAPSWFGSYGGDLMIAAKRVGEIYAITPGGNVSWAANWSKPNAVTFPSSSSSGNGYGGCGSGYTGTCSFGWNHYVLFVANYTSGGLEAYTQNQLKHYAGQGFIAGGLNQGIASFTSSGNTTLFAGNTEKLSDIAFITCFPSSQGNGRGGHGGW
jgi:hypothetical protein